MNIVVQSSPDIQLQVTGPNSVAVAVTTGFPGQNGTNGQDGADGREVELRVSGGFIQWRYVGEATWINLISLDSLRGTDGENGQPGMNGQDGLPGANGTDGREVQLRVSGDWIQWKYDSDVNWINLVSLASITGPQGPAGPNEIDGSTQTTFQGLLAGNGGDVYVPTPGEARDFLQIVDGLVGVPLSTQNCLLPAISGIASNGLTFNRIYALPILAPFDLSIANLRSRVGVAGSAGASVVLAIASDYRDPQGFSRPDQVLVSGSVLVDSIGNRDLTFPPLSVSRGTKIWTLLFASNPAGVQMTCTLHSSRHPALCNQWDLSSTSINRAGLIATSSTLPTDLSMLTWALERYIPIVGVY